MPIEDAVGLLSLLWTPLVVVTASHEDEQGGMIAVSAFAASIVPEQPRLMVEIQKRNHTHGLITASERFAVNVLRRERWEWVRDFGFVSQADGDKFSAAIPWHEGPHCIPLLDDAIGTLVCRVVNAMDGGDMTVFLAVVEEAGTAAGRGAGVLVGGAAVAAGGVGGGVRAQAVARCAGLRASDGRDRLSAVAGGGLAGPVEGKESPSTVTFD